MSSSTDLSYDKALIAFAHHVAYFKDLFAASSLLAHLYGVTKEKTMDDLFSMWAGMLRRGEV